MNKSILRTNSRGFTLIELLVVVVIIAILSGIGIPRLVRAFYQAKDKKVVSVMRNFAIAIGIYRVDCELVPQTTNIHQLVQILTTYQGNNQGEQLQVMATDDWGHEFYYGPSAGTLEEYTLISYGRDGGKSTPASLGAFNPDDDTILITGVFVASHQGGSIVVGH
jgi:general secretion pathway protein G